MGDGIPVGDGEKCLLKTPGLGLGVVARPPGERGWFSFSFATSKPIELPRTWVLAKELAVGAISLEVAEGRGVGLGSEVFEIFESLDVESVMVEARPLLIPIEDTLDAPCTLIAVPRVLGRVPIERSRTFDPFAIDEGLEEVL